MRKIRAIEPLFSWLVVFSFTFQMYRCKCGRFPSLDSVLLSCFRFGDFSLICRPSSNVKVTGNKIKTHYDTLGVSRAAEQSQIKEAFYELSKAYHPDKRKTSTISDDKFKDISEAYTVLSNEATRKAYDQQLRLNESPYGSQQYQTRQERQMWV